MKTQFKTKLRDMMYLFKTFKKIENTKGA